jgi:hypothetical protein
MSDILGRPLTSITQQSLADKAYVNLIPNLAAVMCAGVSAMWLCRGIQYRVNTGLRGFRESLEEALDIRAENYED